MHLLNRSGAAHSSSAVEPCVVLEEKASVNVECEEVAKVTPHDFWRTKDGLPPVEGTEKKNWPFCNTAKSSLVGRKANVKG